MLSLFCDGCFLDVLEERQIAHLITINRNNDSKNVEISTHFFAMLRAVFIDNHDCSAGQQAE
jgi:hypothetical protein